MAVPPSDRSADADLTAPPGSRALRRVAKGDSCAGCGACALVAPGAVTMAMQPPGYLRPVQSAPLRTDQEATIAAICPGLIQTVEAAGRQDDPLWGPWLEMRKGHATAPDLRHEGASGGGLSAVLVHLLDTGAVDGVVQIAADPAQPTGNITVISTDRDAILAAAGSRYAPSTPLAALGPVLEGPGRYAFVGKPCDAAALRALGARDPRVGARIPYILSFFCAGVPSEQGADQLLSKMGTRPADTVRFRYRGRGWPGQATATDRDGTERSMSYHDSWGKVLSHHVQTRCKLCADGTGVAADLVFGDAWESDARGYPVFDDAPGTSLIVVRNATGAALLAAAEARGALATDIFDAATLAGLQPGQRRRRRALLARLIGRRLAGRPVPRYRGLQLLAAARQNGLSDNLRACLGMLRRSLQGRR